MLCSVDYRRFGTNYRPPSSRVSSPLGLLESWTDRWFRNVDCLQFSLAAWLVNMGPVFCPETSTACSIFYCLIREYGTSILYRNVDCLQYSLTAWLVNMGPVFSTETSTAYIILWLLDPWIWDQYFVPKHRLLTVFFDCLTPWMWTSILYRDVDCLQYSLTAWLVNMGSVFCTETSTAYSILWLLDSWIWDQYFVPKHRLLTVFFDCLTPWIWTSILSRNIDCLQYSLTAWPREYGPVFCTETSTAYSIVWLLDPWIRDQYLVPKRRLLTVFFDCLTPWIWDQYLVPKLRLLTVFFDCLTREYGTSILSRNVDCLQYSLTALLVNMGPVFCPETSTAWPLKVEPICCPSKVGSYW